MRQEAALFDVTHKPPYGDVIQDKLEVVQLLNGLAELVHLTEHIQHDMWFALRSELSSAVQPEWERFVEKDERQRYLSLINCQFLRYCVRFSY